MNNIILHIPHSSLKLPFGFFKNVITDKKIVKDFNKNISDLYTDELFGNNKLKQIKADYSRIYCDVEKFADDDKEIMSKFGMGFIYTHTNNGINFINPTKTYKSNIYNNYYIIHHIKLDKIVNTSLKKGNTILLDCHSFSKDIIMFEDKKENLPDICIGFDDLYYNETIVNYIKDYFDKLNYSVKFNYPYSGTIIPNKFFENKVKNLFCVMIEINKRVYLNQDNSKNTNFKILQNQIQQLLAELQNLKI